MYDLLLQEKIWSTSSRNMNFAGKIGELELDNDFMLLNFTCNNETKQVYFDPVDPDLEGKRVWYGNYDNMISD